MKKNNLLRYINRFASFPVMASMTGFGTYFYCFLLGHNVWVSMFVGFLITSYTTSVIQGDLL